MSEKSIYIRKKINYRNSFQTVLRASIAPLGQGTKSVIFFGLHPFVKIFMFFWFGFAVLIGGAIFILTLSSIIKKSPIDIGTIMGILIPPSLIFSGIVLLIISKLLSADDSTFLKKFLKNLLDAKENIDVEHVAGGDRGY